MVVDSYMILRNEKVLFTPHIAFYTAEALKRIMATSVKNIKAYMKKKPQNNVAI